MNKVFNSPFSFMAGFSLPVLWCNPHEPSVTHMKVVVYSYLFFLEVQDSPFSLLCVLNCMISLIHIKG